MFKKTALTPLEINNGLDKSNGNASKIVKRKKRFLSLTGFTLIELLISIVILGMITIGLAYILTSGMKTYTQTHIQVELLNQARIALDRLSRELRQAESLTTTQSDDIVFTADLTNDGLDNPTTIEYNLSGTNLVRTEDTTSHTIATNISSFQLTYDADFNKVTINLTLTYQSASSNLTTTVRLRNL